MMVTQVGLGSAVKYLLTAEAVLQRKALSRRESQHPTKVELDGRYLQCLSALGFANRYSWLEARLPSF